MSRRKLYKKYDILSKIVGAIGIILGSGLILFGIIAKLGIVATICSIAGGLVAGFAGITGSVLLEEKSKTEKGKTMAKHHNKNYTVERLENDKQKEIEKSVNLNTKNSAMENKKDNELEF